MRVVGGSSQEFLWDVDIHPLQKPREFLNGKSTRYLQLLREYDRFLNVVQGLVHSTFKDAKGYVEV